MSNFNISIRKFSEKDIENKVKWINDSKNNSFLHYDLPLRYDKTLAWYNRIKDSVERFDGVIECDGIPVGIIGLLNIDKKNRKAEYYITMGEPSYKGKGAAFDASKQLIDYAFKELNLNKVYLYTETENIVTQKLFDKLGFQNEGLLKSDLIINGIEKDRYAYGLFKGNWNV